MAAERRTQNGRNPKGASMELRPSAQALQVGVGTAMAHHGELLQGVFEGDDHRLHRGLVTLPFASLQSLATFWPRASGGIRTRPRRRVKAARAAALTLDYLGFPEAAGDLTIESKIPIGHGYGSSTADVIASIRAAAAAAGATLRRSTVSRLAVTAEGASDAIAYGDQAVLFAQREGFLIEHFAGDYPPLVVVGFRARSGRPVDTMRLPRARYDSGEIEQFRALRGLASYAVRRQDAHLMGRIATASTRISQRHLGRPQLEAAIELAEGHGACGVQIAHSGSLMGALFNAGETGARKRASVLAERLRQSGFKGVVLFAVCSDGAVPP